MIYKCGWCLQPFEKDSYRHPGEAIPLRSRLLIADLTFEPIICDGCYEAQVGRTMHAGQAMPVMDAHAIPSPILRASIYADS